MCNTIDFMVAATFCISLLAVMGALLYTVLWG